MSALQRAGALGLSERPNAWLNDLPGNGPKAEAYKDALAQSYIDQAQKLQDIATSPDAELAQLPRRAKGLGTGDSRMVISNERYDA